MARSEQGTADRGQITGVIRAAGAFPAAGLAIAAGLLCAFAGEALAQGQPPALTRECTAPGTSTATESPLPNVAAALQRKKRIRILAIGAASTAGMGNVRGGYQALMLKMIKEAAKGVEVEVVNRGISGELAEQAAQRLKIQVGLTAPDLVLWQVGTNDALSYVEVERVEHAVTETVRWLKEHKVDVVLVGLQYVSGMARDSHYQAIRVALRRIAQQENVIIVRRYEAMEILERAQRAEPGAAADEFANSESAYDCMAQYVARAISVALFGRNLAPTPSPP
jgi:lysophospholipase L1-like esterase